ncbi:MAG: hypothetical protein LBN21_01370 [Treponema sp.]|jgi:predicted nucleic acid-binding protein|nr:hypothetical protein [Treponema sp.]
MHEVILDSNIFILFFAGQINPNRISKYCRNALYVREDFLVLTSILDNYDTILTCPNILTEVDNILNRITGEDKNKYLSLIRGIFNRSVEKYIESQKSAAEWYFTDLGLADSSILTMAKDADLLISGDSRLCDIAKSMQINIFDFKEYQNKKLDGLEYIPEIFTQ